MFYRNCGTKIIENARFCATCGTSLTTNHESIPPPLRQAEYIYKEERRDDDLIYSNGRKSVGLTVFLNFLWPGLGNIYCGQTGKGLSIMFASFVTALLIFFVVGFLLWFLLCIFSIMDGIATAQTLNAVKPVKKWGFF